MLLAERWGPQGVIRLVLVLCASVGIFGCSDSGSAGNGLSHGNDSGSLGAAGVLMSSEAHQLQLFEFDQAVLATPVSSSRYEMVIGGQVFGGQGDGN